MLTKEQKEIRHRFHKFLGNQFDKKNKKHKNATHRWLFCWNNEPSDKIFDCGCCLSNEEEPFDMKCGCICHDRITDIMNFIYKEIKRYE